MKALLTMAVFAISTSTAVAAGAVDVPPSRQGVQDNQRCTALTVQFERAAAQRQVAQAAKDQAAQGEAQCRAGHFGDGIDSLEKALGAIGESPGK